MAGVVSIPAHRNFVGVLAGELLARHGGDPAALARVMVLLPTRRSARALREELVRRNGGPMLLPRIRLLGDLDEDDMPGAEDEDDAGEERAGAPPAIAPLERRLLLAEMARAARPRISGGQALAHAAALASLLDEMQGARVDFAALDTLVQGEHAEHWQHTLEFLRIVTEQWPRVLAERGLADPAARRVSMLERLAEAWRAAPPDTPVIAAGSTGSAPATADLLAVAMQLPKGVVVLPGLDRTLDDASWEALAETHPQFGLKVLLDRFGVDRRRVGAWPETATEPNGAEDAGGAAPMARAALIREAMRPGATAEAWQALGALDSRAVEELEIASCPDEQAEADTIALAMRRALETPGRSAALVTADRGLARRVRAALGRWGLEIDDSAGRPLAETAPGAFMRLIVDALANDLAPVPLLAMLKHPLAGGGEDRFAFLRRVRALERRCLRGPRPDAGFAGLRKAVAALEKPPEGLAAWLGRLAAAAAPLAGLLARASVSLTETVAAHRAFAEWLSAEESGEPAAWKGEAGRLCRDAFDEFARAAGETQMLIAGRDYAACADNAMTGARLRPQRDGHSRLFIWGALEARLQRADLTILGGLNEGSWPRETEGGPWLSRPMRRALGLPAPERAVGLAAHDFAQLAQAPRVLLTRAEKAEGAPTVRARWLTRLDAVLSGAGISADKSAQWTAWRRALDAPEGPPRPVGPPAPRPPLAARPRELPVTRIEAWMRDPYEIYARHILELRALDPIDADAAQAEYGTIVHEALADFIRKNSGPLPADALERLLKAGDAQLEEAGAPEGLRAFWRPRFARVAAWFLEVERERRAEGYAPKAEIEGSIRFDAPGGEFVLTARADRIDRRPDGHYEIIDYKTGAPPSGKEVLAGYAPQLPLEGAILKQGGFRGIPAAPLAALSYWRLTGRDPAGAITAPRDKSAEALAAEALKGVRALVALYDDPETPYPARPAPRHAPKYSDYEHLARVGEWSAAGGDSP